MGAATTLTLKLRQSTQNASGSAAEIHLHEGTEGSLEAGDRPTGVYYPPPAGAPPVLLLIVVELVAFAATTVHALRVDLFGEWGVPALVAHDLPECGPGRTTIALVPTSSSARVTGGLPRVITRVRVRWAFAGEGVIHDRDQEFLAPTGTGR